ncbi:MAG: chloride channel protein [Bacteroidaceae bacterium]|nr:chloride channel protein [Bacteroidaceae bacterium]
MNSSAQHTFSLENVVKWRSEHISDSRFVLILSVLVGFFAALAATLLHTLIHVIQQLLTHGFDITGANFLYLLYPVVGIYLSGVFIRRVVRDDISHGVTRILYAISRRQARIRGHNMWSSIVASGITIGFGGSVGAEAPIVLTGSAIGSNLGSLFNLDRRYLLLLVGCGAAGAVAGIFKAPIAGLVFVVEVLMIDLTMSSLLPLMLSSVTATTVSYIFNGMEPMFKFSIENAFTLDRIPFVILLGIFCGFVSLYFSETMNACEGLIAKIKGPYRRLLICGIVLSVLIFLFPSLYGEGYDTINLLINNHLSADWNQVMNNSFFFGHAHMLIVYLGLVLLFKVFASVATNGGGGCGGIFAPSLFLGCIAGFIFAHVCNSLHIGPFMPEENFALFGMAGLMSGVMHAPLTGIFLIAELTGGYGLLLPLMIVSAASYLTIRIFQRHSIYSMRLAKKGELLTHHTDKSVLVLMRTENVIEKNFTPLSPDMDLGQLVNAISRSSRNLFPVLNAEQQLVGIVFLDDVRKLMFRTELYHRYTVDKLMKLTPARLLLTDSMDAVMHKFDETKAWNLPVEDENGVYQGFISRSKIFNEYRRLIVDFSDE